MKKAIVYLALCVMMSWLAGCGSYPDQADDGTSWDTSWEMMGRVMGVEEPGNGLVLLENNVVLGADDTWYATWAVGEPESYVNEDGDNTDLYSAQMYLLLYGCENEEQAARATVDWIARENETYAVRSTQTETWNGQEYTVLYYDVPSESNPYDRGVSVFGLFHNYVVAAELACVESFTGNEESMMSDFLSRCHYSSEYLH